MQAGLLPAHGLQGAAMPAALQQALGHVQHALAGAVALAQTADAQGGPDGAQAVFALAAGATEAVDGLVRVADAEKAAAVLGQQGADQTQLHRGKVLHLVHQHMPPGQGRSSTARRRQGGGGCRGGHHAQQGHLARYGATRVRGVVMVGRRDRPAGSRGRGRARPGRTAPFRHRGGQQGPAGLVTIGLLPQDHQPARHGMEAGQPQLLLRQGKAAQLAGRGRILGKKALFIRRPGIEIRRLDGIAQTLHGTQAAVDHPGQPRPVELPGQIHGRMQDGMGRQAIQKQQGIGRHRQQTPQRQRQLERLPQHRAQHEGQTVLHAQGAVSQLRRQMPVTLGKAAFLPPGRVLQHLLQGRLYGAARAEGAVQQAQGPQGQGRCRGRELPQTAAFRKMAAAFRGKDLSGRIPACFPCCSYHKYHFEIK